MPPAAPTLDDLRRHALARSLFTPTTLPKALRRLGFVQADPIRAPARAQDLILRHRVKDYRAGELERRYARLPIDEDCLVNYGFLPREHLALMHPRQPAQAWDAVTRRRATEILGFVRERGAVRPAEVEQHFGHGHVRNPWGGRSRACTQLLDAMHHRGLLRVQRREAGVRVYTAVAHPPVDDSPAARAQRAQALIDLIVRLYAPLPSASLVYLVRLLRLGAPHLRAETQVALQHARARLPSVRLDGCTWLWPEDEDPRSGRHRVDDRLRLLAPFDPVVWDRRRFALFWGWAYTFEAYTPAAQRRFGHYALPMLWQGQVIGWANASVQEGRLELTLGHASGAAPRGKAYRQALDEERGRLCEFMGLG